MKNKELPRPTDAELAILQVLWESGPSTVRQVQEVLQETRPKGYTTVLKLLQIMLGKKLVQRDASSWSHVYSTVQPAEQTQRQLVGDLLSRAFRGSTSQLVMQALAMKPTSTEELAEIREYLDELKDEER